MNDKDLSLLSRFVKKSRRLCDEHANKLQVQIGLINERLQNLSRPRDHYLTTLLAGTYIGKQLTLNDGGKMTIGICTGINDLYADKPIFEINGELCAGIPTQVRSIPQ